MASTSSWGMTPRRSVEAECRRRGKPAVVAGCVDLLAGKEVDPTLIVALGGPAAGWATSGGDSGPDYWLRVWGARGLLWAWDDSATSALVGASRDPAWRVREMTAKVVARHRLDALLGELGRLRDDPVPRVRAAADRAIVRIIAG